MTNAKAQMLVDQWNQIHDEADSRENAGDHMAAERLRRSASGIQATLRASGYDVDGQTIPNKPTP